MADDYIPLLREVPDDLDEDRVRGLASEAITILDELVVRGIELPPELVQQIEETRQASSDLLAVLEEEDG